jgi:hypothetical protein
MFHVDALQEANMVRRFQQQLEEEFGKLGAEQVAKGEVTQRKTGNS